MRRSRTEYRVNLPSRANQRGTITVELLVVLPIIALIGAALVQFALMLLADQKLLLAAYNGATAARHDGTEDDIAFAVDKAMPQIAYKNNRIIKVYRVDPPVIPNDPPVDVLIATISPTNVVTLANPPVDVASQPSLAAIKVTVEVQADKVVPNMLKYVKYDLANYTLVGAVVLPKE
jgi:hypothetical protein